MAALDLTTDYPKSSFSFDTIERKGFTFDPNFMISDFDQWKESVWNDLGASSEAMSKYLSTAPVSDVSSAISAQSLFGIKALASKQMAGGAMLKSAAAAGKLFSDLITVGYNWRNINMQRDNAKLDAENQMKAIDNQILYFKNQIAERFNQTMARNAVTMAAKNLRVTAANLMEQTKDAAYDATQDISMAESNAELKKILLRSQQKQADVAAKLAKSNEISTLVGDAANLGLMIGTGGGTFQTWGDIRKSVSDEPGKWEDVEASLGYTWGKIKDSGNYTWNTITDWFNNDATQGE